MKLETDRLILGAYQESDFAHVHEYGSVPEFSQYEPWGPNTEEETRQFINRMIEEAAAKDRYKFNFAVRLKENDRLIGGIGIRRESQDSVVANLGWAITPKVQGRGFATEGAARLIKFGFDELKLKVIYATCDARNVISARVMEKLGMKRVGLLLKDKVQKGHQRDTLRFEIYQS